MSALLGGLGRAGGRPVDGRSLAIVRVGVGLVAALTSVRTLRHGWIEQLWLGPEVHLQWAWPAPPVPPSPVLHAEVVVLGLLGLLVAAGVGVRPAAWAWAAGTAHLDLLDQATYLNHHVALVLVAVLVGVVRADGTWSLAAGRRGAGTVPAWQVWLLRGQVAVVYVGAGVAKLDPDWLLRGEPLATWLAARGDVPVVGPLLGLGGVAVALSWAAVAFDLTVVWWLRRPRTRVPAMVAVVAFHTVTGVLFPTIGVFPLVMVVLATVWLPPGWPARVAAAAHRCRGGAAAGPPAAPGAGRSGPRPGTTAGRPHRAAVPLLGVAAWVALQAVLPLRHLAAPGDVRWNEDGGRFAWRVMAEEKVGWARFEVVHADGTVERVAVDELLEPWQAHVAAVRPDMLVRAAHVLADRVEATGAPRPTVVADAWVAWNGRPAARLLDPAADLAALAPSAASAAVLPAPP